MAIDSETLIKNCSTYQRLHVKAVDVLRKANGKRHYKEIAKLLGIHPTTASYLLGQAKRLGLAVKHKGLYKRIPGIMGYMPKSLSRNLTEMSVPEMVEQMRNKKRRTQSASVSFGKSFQDKARKMSLAYEWLYVTENTLRALVRNVLGKNEEWWENDVNEKIRNDVKDLVDNYRYDAEPRRDELEFTHLGQLKEIIIAKSNWARFMPYLKEKDKNKFAAVVDKAIPFRNSIAHSTPLSSNGFKKVEIRFQDVLDMIR